MQRAGNPSSRPPGVLGTRPLGHDHGSGAGGDRRTVGELKLSPAAFPGASTPTTNDPKPIGGDHGMAPAAPAPTQRDEVDIPIPE